MSAKVIPLQRWLQCFQEATRDLVSVSMRFDGAPPAKGKPTQARPGGAYIAVLGEDASLHLGICTSPEGFRTLSRALLGIRRDEELTDKDVVDGASEVMNIVAGKVKSRMSGEDGTLRLGLPMFVTGEIQMTAGMEREIADVSIGPVPCQLQVYRVRRAA
jgi:hypothetical protein